MWYNTLVNSEIPKVIFLIITFCTEFRKFESKNKIYNISILINN